MCVSRLREVSVSLRRTAGWEVKDRRPHVGRLLVQKVSNQNIMDYNTVRHLFLQINICFNTDI